MPIRTDARLLEADLVDPTAEGGVAFSVGAPVEYRFRLQGEGQATLWAAWEPAVKLDAELIDSTGQAIALASGVGWLMATCALPESEDGEQICRLTLTPPAGGDEVAGTFHLAEPDTSGGWMTEAQLQNELAAIEADRETLRNQRQMASTEFENANKIAGQMINMVAQVLKTINEMQKGIILNIR